MRTPVIAEELLRCGCAVGACTGPGGRVMNEVVPQQGLFASLKRLLATLLEIAQVRLGLVLNELDQQKLRLFDALLIAAASWWRWRSGWCC